MEHERIDIAPAEILNDLYDMLNERNMRVDQGDVDLIASFMSHWLEHTKRGKEYMVYLLKLHTTRSRDDMDHFIHYPTIPVPQKLDSKKLFFVSGCIYDSDVIPPHMITSKPKETTSCESCGAGVICGQEFKGKTLCSNCLDWGEDSAGKDIVEISCENCNFTKCSWHPVNKDTPPLALSNF